jgi:hypothetical protein
MVTEVPPTAGPLLGLTEVTTGGAGGGGDGLGKATGDGEGERDGAGEGAAANGEGEGVTSGEGDSLGEGVGLGEAWAAQGAVVPEAVLALGVGPCPWGTFDTTTHQTSFGLESQSFTL